MKVLLIGARGFIGSALLDELVSRNDNVMCTTRGALPNDTANVRWSRLETSSQKSWDEAVEDDFDVVYHLGWSTTPSTSAKDPAADFIENVGGSLRLLSSIRNMRRQPRLIFSSSGGTIYGRVQGATVAETHERRPISSYGLGKLAFENTLLAERSEKKLDCVSVRISNPYGPSQNTERTFGAISTFVKRAIEGQAISIFGSGEIVRDYIYISDVIQALVKLADAEHVPPAVNLGSGVGTNLFEIIAAIELKMEKKLDFKMFAHRDFDIERIVLDVSLIKSLIDWNPKVSLQKGIGRTIDDKVG